MGIEREKQIAAEAAAELVESGMTVGLGTGSTVAYLLPALAKRSLSILCAATSPRTEHRPVRHHHRRRRPDRPGRLAGQGRRRRTYPGEDRGRGRGPVRRYRRL